ncbi:MAG: hypothetical protein M3Y72_15125 [Acidobacteriota bacterium]|nr:hypothetical protein [Acidobacteriota bacterium]
MRARSALGSLMAAVALTGCGNHFSSGIAIDPALQKFVSPDTVVLAGIDLSKIRATPFYARHRKQLDLPQLNTFSGQSGFDFRRDLSTLVLMWNGKEMVIAGRGKFSKDKIQQQLAGASSRTQYKKYTLFESHGDAVSFVNAELAVAGNTHSVKSAIDTEENRNGQVPAELSAGISKLPRADQIWLVSRGGLPFADMPGSSERKSILSNFAGYVRATSAAIALDSGLHFKAEIDCNSDAGAKRVNDGVRGGIGFARLAIKNKDLDILPLYDAVHVRQDKETVYIDADLSPDLADKLLNRFVAVQFSTEMSSPH